jgi:hypothetical protein
MLKLISKIQMIKNQHQRRKISKSNDGNPLIKKREFLRYYSLMRLAAMGAALVSIVIIADRPRPLIVTARPSSQLRH